MFNCDPESNTSIIVADGIQNDFDDEGVDFCKYKSLMICFSLALLIPFMMESLIIVWILLYSMVFRDLKIPIVNGRYVAVGVIFENLMHPNPFVRLLVSLSPRLDIFFKLDEYMRPCGICGGRNLTLMYLRIIGTFFMLAVADLLLSFYLFIVAYYLMQESTSHGELLVNLVATQILGQLDEIIVKTLLKPRSSVAQALQIYLIDDPDSLEPKYSPFDNLYPV